MRILIIEDDAAMARQLASYLQRNGLIPSVAPMAEAGQIHTDQVRYDLALFDIGLTGQGAIPILEQWRTTGHDLPVILLTARTHKMATMRGLQAGADDYINIPYDLADVLARIHTNNV